MKPRELIFDLRRTVVPVVSAQKAAAKLEQFAALADELEPISGMLTPKEVAKRIREILEET